MNYSVNPMYRPFDDRFTFYTGKSKGFVAYPRSELFNHLNKNENVSLITCRQLSTFDFQHLFTSRLVSDMCNISSQTKETGYIFSLYQYPESTAQQTIETSPNPSKGGEQERGEQERGGQERVPNLNMDIVNQIAENLGLRFVSEKETSPNPSERGEQGSVFESDGAINEVLGESVLN